VRLVSHFRVSAIPPVRTANRCSERQQKLLVLETGIAMVFKDVLVTWAGRNGER